jgi:hypothetical protein
MWQFSPPPILQYRSAARIYLVCLAFLRSTTFGQACVDAAISLS